MEVPGAIHAQPLQEKEMNPQPAPKGGSRETFSPPLSPLQTSSDISLEPSAQRGPAFCY